MNSEVGQVNPKKRVFKYTLKDKQFILRELKHEEASNNGMSKRAIARKYGIDESSLRQWQKSIDLTEDVTFPSNNLTLHTGKPSKGEHLEGPICFFIDSLREKRCDITVELLAFEVMKIDPSFLDKKFVPIRKWLYSFLRRNNYSIREKTHVAQKVINMQDCADFVEMVNERNSVYNISKDFIINMDETPLYNDQKPNKTVADKGSRSVEGLKTRTGDYRSTVMLSVTASGKKLPPMIIFKGQPGKTIEKNLFLRMAFRPV